MKTKNPWESERDEWMFINSLSDILGSTTAGEYLDAFRLCETHDDFLRMQRSLGRLLDKKWEEYINAEI
jgi:hypothetical protein